MDRGMDIYRLEMTLRWDYGPARVCAVQPHLEQQWVGLPEYKLRGFEHV